MTWQDDKSSERDVCAHTQSVGDEGRAAGRWACVHVHGVWAMRVVQQEGGCVPCIEGIHSSQVAQCVRSA